MSHPTPSGNGCSLEDCYTNLFVLTDICGIRWRRLSLDSAGFDQLDDPLLVAYTKCIQNDILCVWRRVLKNSDHRLNPNDQLSYHKELWIFWYGDQPSFLEDLLSGDTSVPVWKEQEQGAWDRDRDSGLTYECRTLFFKALHNLIERCLLSRRFVRLGKWFVMPQDPANRDKQCHLSFCFHFFLHGESQVCASIEVKQHPPVRLLSQQHITMVQESQVNVQVILAPYGLNGTITGQTYDDDTDPQSRLLFQHWNQYYPVDSGNIQDNDAKYLPSLVEVVVAGVRMRYPSAYVLVTESEDGSGTSHVVSAPTVPFVDRGCSSNVNSHQHPYHLSTSPLCCSGGVSADCQSKLTPGDARPSNLPSVGQVYGQRITQRAAEDATLTPGRHIAANLVCSKRLLNSAPGHQEDPCAVSGTWHFSDPATKTTCCCAKHQKLKQVAQAKVKFGKKDKEVERCRGDVERYDKKMERFQCRQTGRATAAFHRRLRTTDDVIHFDVDRLMSQIPSDPAFCPTGTTTIAPQTNSVPPPDGSVETPNSPPSPLDTPHVNLPWHEPTMPTLSPHPPGKFGVGVATSVVVRAVGAACSSGSHVFSCAGGLDSVTGTAYGVSRGSSGTVDNGVKVCVYSGDFGSSGHDSVGHRSCVGGRMLDRALERPLPSEHSASRSAVGAERFAMREHSDCHLVTGASDRRCDSAAFGELSAACGTDMSGASVASPLVQLRSTQHVKCEWLSRWIRTRQAGVNELKRPGLRCSDSGDDDESHPVGGSLYSRDSTWEWTHFPLKRNRFDCPSENFLLDVSPVSGLEPITPPSVSLRFRPQSPIRPSLPDPYEFSDEASINPDTMTTCVKSTHSQHSCELGLVTSPVYSSGDLTRERDLQVTGAEQDLAHLFESSSSGDEDECAVTTDINLSGTAATEDHRSNCVLQASELADSIIPHSELTRMYPTPPSLEANKHSPETAPPSDALVEAMVERLIVKTERLSPIKQRPTASIVDASKFDVFLPTKRVLYVSTPKYSQLPACQLPSLSAGYTPQYKPSSLCLQHAVTFADALHHIHRLNYVNLPSVGAVSRASASPAFAQQQRTPRTPMSYELQSPASTPSSYLNRTLNSMDNTGTNSQLPEVHSLLVNVLLSDTTLNLFRDYNFDSCNMCVCNMDIRGSDSGIYVPDMFPASESSYKCTCGFSAFINRRFASDAGLFLEDEVDVTGIRDDKYDRCRAPRHAVMEGDSGAATSDVPSDVLHLLMEQFASSFPNCITTNFLSMLNTSVSTASSGGQQVDVFSWKDGNEVVYLTLDVARQAHDNNCCSHKLDDHSMRMTCLHKWPFIRGVQCLPRNSQDIVQCLKSLQPLLQDAVQYKTITRLWEHTYKLQGPLSWKDFHQLSGRSSVESSCPQPVPNILASYDRDWLSLSPYAVRFWDKQCLEPFGRPRDVIYVVVAPDNESILQHVRAYFCELSSVYDSCRLGRHVPIKPLRDGIMRIGKNTAQKVCNEPVDDWFDHLGYSEIGVKLKLYAQVLKHLLAPLLLQQSLDQSAFDGSSHQAQFKTPEPCYPATPEAMQSPNGPSSVGSLSGNQSSEENKENTHQGSDVGSVSWRDAHHSDGDGGGGLEDAASPAVVIYLIDSFSCSDEGQRSAVVGLLRAYAQMMLPSSFALHTFLQLVPLSAVQDHRFTSASTQVLKSMAFSVYTACRLPLRHTVQARSLTGFGPASAADLFLRSKRADQAAPMRLYSPPYILAPSSVQQGGDGVTADLNGDCGDHTSVLFVAYCLSHDQRYLLAVCTDCRGELLDTCTINIHIPNRSMRRKVSARKHALSSLWDYILGIISLSRRSARIVIGRLGRIGHGELKGWSGLLGKRNLQAAGRRVRDMCPQCNLASESPGVRSACVVSMEMNPSFQVMADVLKQEEKQASYLPLQTPRDASVTHILVFPTSATAQVNANPLPSGDPCNALDSYLGDVFGEEVFSDMGQELSNMGQGMDGMEFSIMDILDNPFDPQPGSPTNNQDRARQSLRTNEPSLVSNGLPLSADPQEDNNLLQQPLAMGYYLSTAPSGPLPQWLWSSCPQNQHLSPVCFKASLHVNISSRQWQDELDHSSSCPDQSGHPLDSHLTCDVLRFVLANYNSLSWLTYDPSANDRRSCLPVHKAVLVQMYHAMQAYL